MGPIAWLITFCCHGNWLPGDRRGYVERTAEGGVYRAPPSYQLRTSVEQRMRQGPFLLSAPARAVVTAAIRGQCLHAGWDLHAVHVRTNHLHVVLSGTDPPARMMNQLKSWSTRRLREANLIDSTTRPWSRHGSTVSLRTTEAVEAARHYVINTQGPTLDSDS